MNVERFQRIFLLMQIFKIGRDTTKLEIATKEIFDANPTASPSAVSTGVANLEDEDSVKRFFEEVEVN
jgi:hypothetical protein